MRYWAVPGPGKTVSTAPASRGHPVLGRDPAALATRAAGAVGQGAALDHTGLWER